MRARAATIWTGIVLGLAASAAPAAQAAQLLVIASTAPELPAGTFLDSARPLALPAGAQVTLVAEDGRTATLEGPFEGVLALGGDGGDPGLLGKLAALVRAPTQESSALGAVRAADVRAPSDPWAIEVSRPGRYCVRGGAVPRLWRPSAAQAGVLSLKQASSGQRATATWPRGEATVAWPKDMAVADGRSYRMQMRGGTSPKRLVLRIVPSALANDALRAAWMADAGCERQARRLLATLR